MKEIAKKVKTLPDLSLKDSEIRYRRLFETAQDGILMLDAGTGMIEDVNPYLIKMLGYSRKEFIKKKLWEIGAFKDVEASQDAFEALQKKKYICYEDLPLKAKDGRLIRVEFVSNFFLVGGEKMIQCNIRDITKHKPSQTNLRESEERFRFLFENNPLPMWVYDLKTLAFLAVNNSAIEKYGYTRGEFLRMTIADIRPVEDIPRLNGSVARERSILEHAGEWRHCLKDGTIIDVEVTSHTLRMDEHDSAFVVVHDITERKQAEESMNLQITALNAAANSIMITNRDGVIEWVNLAFTTITGYTAEEAIGRNPRELVGSGKQDQAFYKQLWETILAGEVWHNELINRRKDGSFYTEEETITPLKDANGKISHFTRLLQHINS